MYVVDVVAVEEVVVSEGSFVVAVVVIVDCSAVGSVVILADAGESKTYAYLRTKFS